MHCSSAALLAPTSGYHLDLADSCWYLMIYSAVCCRVWSLKTGELVNTLQHHSEAVLHLRFADGIMVTCSKVCAHCNCTVLQAN